MLGPWVAGGPCVTLDIGDGPWVTLGVGVWSLEDPELVLGPLVTPGLVLDPG